MLRSQSSVLSQRSSCKGLHGLLENHMLRRLKRDVLKGLPKKRKAGGSLRTSTRPTFNRRTETASV